MTRRRIPVLLRLLAAPLVAGMTVAGVWVSGGLISNDFAVSMWLTVGWMVLVAVFALGLAAQHRAFRWPVLIGYAAAALGLAAFLGPSALFDDVVDEPVAMAAPVPPSPARAHPSRAPSRPGNVLLRSGRFQPVRHGANGVARIIRLTKGGRVLTLTSFDVANGPDLRVYLAAGPARTEGGVDDVVDLGALKGNRGDQQYRIPAGTNVGKHSTVVIWCRAFSVLFARAPLQAR